MPELNPSAQRCLPRFFTGDFNLDNRWIDLPSLSFPNFPSPPQQWGETSLHSQKQFFGAGTLPGSTAQKILLNTWENKIFLGGFGAPNRVYNQKIFYLTPDKTKKFLAAPTRGLQPTWDSHGLLPIFIFLSLQHSPLSILNRPRGFCPFLAPTEPPLFWNPHFGQSMAFARDPLTFPIFILARGFCPFLGPNEPCTPCFEFWVRGLCPLRGPGFCPFLGPIEPCNPLFLILGPGALRIDRPNGGLLYKSFHIKGLIYQRREQTKEQIDRQTNKQASQPVGQLTN
jgi:hypothetical protein